MAQPDDYLLGRGEAEEAALSARSPILPQIQTRSSKRLGSTRASAFSTSVAVRAGSCTSWVSGSVPPAQSLESSGAPFCRLGAPLRRGSRAAAGRSSRG